MKTNIFESNNRYIIEIDLLGIKKENDIKATYKKAILEISFSKEDISKKEIKNITVS